MRIVIIGPDRRGRYATNLTDGAIVRRPASPPSGATRRPRRRA